MPLGVAKRGQTGRGRGSDQDETVIARRCWRWLGRGQRSRPRRAGGLHREEAVRGGAPGHAGGAGRHRVPHAAQQPGLLAQGQRPHHPRGLPGAAGRPLRGEASWLRGPCGHPGAWPGVTASSVRPQMSQHMKLKLQFTASVANPPPEARPVSRKSSPSSPAVRDLVERHQAGLGRSQSFSHQQPSRSHLMRYRGTAGTWQGDT